ncbi:MAG TPA: Gfo/Idh/MocA family oxidoreductase [Hyphomonadaceae bacterium]|nr:Gfo/Idh/MocA family oxidoreductase [Hyphomonadaceae bacterium]
MSRRLRLGMVGGGEGAFIGAVHRMAARIDDQWELVAGAFQSNAVKSKAFGQSLNLSADRCYGDYGAMAKAEATRADRIDAVSIVTPNHLHHAVAKVFLDAGIPVICDKPLTINSTDAEDLAAKVKASGLPFVLTHNYSGYPMVRQTRAMIEAGQLGKLRVIQVEYAQDWLATDLKDQKQADWRGDPKRAGPGGALGDIATHAFHLAEFVSGTKAKELAADLSTFVPGRRVDDNVNVMLRFDGGAKGMLWASQVAAGKANGLQLRIYGERAGLEWSQEHPEELRFAPLNEAPRILRRGGPGISASAQRATRLPPGHPEGYLEGFAQIYSDAAELVRAHHDKRKPDPLALLVPGVADGVRGVRFIEAAVASSGKNGAWTALG